MSPLRLRQAGLGIALIGLGTVVTGTAASAQPDYCERGFLDEQSRSATAYKYRGNRCEGAHPLPISSSKLDLMSFTERFDYQPTRGDTLAIRWSEPPSADASHIRLRARSLDILGGDTFYRMDSAASATDRMLSWPSDVIGALRLEKVDLGVLGWMPLEVPSFGIKDVYLPLRVTPEGQRGDDTLGDSYRMVLTPRVKLEEVTLAISRVRPDGTAVDEIVPARELGWGFYPPNQPLRIEIPRPAEAGLYRVDVVGRFYRDTSLSASADIWIYSH